jgi:hypothetical protein
MAGKVAARTAKPEKKDRVPALCRNVEKKYRLKVRLHQPSLRFVDGQTDSGATACAAFIRQDAMPASEPVNAGSSGVIRLRRAAAYTRMSTDHQQFSIENQMHVIQEYARARGIEVVRRYSDAMLQGRASTWVVRHPTHFGAW